MTDHEKRIREAVASGENFSDNDLRALLADLDAARSALSEAKAGGWQPIETAPVGREMFVVIGVTSGNGFTGGRPYTSDPYCVWQPEKGEFSRWPHNWAPTHWQPLPAPPAQRGEG